MEIEIGLRRAEHGCHSQSKLNAGVQGLGVHSLSHPKYHLSQSGTAFCLSQSDRHE